MSLKAAQSMWGPEAGRGPSSLSPAALRPSPSSPAGICHLLLPRPVHPPGSPAKVQGASRDQAHTAPELRACSGLCSGLGSRLSHAVPALKAATSSFRFSFRVKLSGPWSYLGLEEGSRAEAVSAGQLSPQGPGWPPHPGPPPSSSSSSPSQPLSRAWLVGTLRKCPA